MGIFEKIFSFTKDVKCNVCGTVHRENTICPKCNPVLQPEKNAGLLFYRCNVGVEHLKARGVALGGGFSLMLLSQNGNVLFESSEEKKLNDGLIECINNLGDFDDSIGLTLLWVVHKGPLSMEIEIPALANKKGALLESRVFLNFSWRDWGNIVRTFLRHTEKLEQEQLKQKISEIILQQLKTRVQQTEYQAKELSGTAQGKILTEQLKDAVLASFREIGMELQDLKLSFSDPALEVQQAYQRKEAEEKTRLAHDDKMRSLQHVAELAEIERQQEEVRLLNASEMEKKTAAYSLRMADLFKAHMEAKQKQEGELSLEEAMQDFRREQAYRDFMQELGAEKLKEEQHARLAEDVFRRSEEQLRISFANRLQMERETFTEEIRQEQLTADIKYQSELQCISLEKMRQDMLNAREEAALARNLALSDARRDEIREQQKLAEEQHNTLKTLGGLAEKNEIKVSMIFPGAGVAGSGFSGAASIGGFDFWPGMEKCNVRIYGISDDVTWYITSFDKKKHNMGFLSSTKGSESVFRLPAGRCTLSFSCSGYAEISDCFEIKNGASYCCNYPTEEHREGYVKLPPVVDPVKPMEKAPRFFICPDKAPVFLVPGQKICFGRDKRFRCAEIDITLRPLNYKDDADKRHDGKSISRKHGFFMVKNDKLYYRDYSSKGCHILTDKKEEIKFPGTDKKDIQDPGEKQLLDKGTLCFALPALELNFQVLRRDKKICAVLFDRNDQVQQYVLLVRELFLGRNQDDGIIVGSIPQESCLRLVFKDGAFLTEVLDKKSANTCNIKLLPVRDDTEFELNLHETGESDLTEE